MVEPCTANYLHSCKMYHVFVKSLIINKCTMTRVPGLHWLWNCWLLSKTWTIMRRHSFSTMILPKITAVQQVRYRLKQPVNHRLPIRISTTYLQIYNVRRKQMTEIHRKWCLLAWPRTFNKSQSTRIKKEKKMRCMSDSSCFAFRVQCLRRYLSHFLLRCAFMRRVQRHV